MAKGMQELLGTGSGKERKDGTHETHGTNSEEVAGEIAAAGSIGDVLGAVKGVQVEAVVGGALMTVVLGPGTNPAEVAGMLRALDPNAKVRDDWPKRGSWGNRETKSARCMVINVRAQGEKVYWELICSNGDDFTVMVPSKKGDEFAQQLANLGKLKEADLDKLATVAAEKKGKATVMLMHEEHQFGVKYWKSDDGQAFLDSIEAEAPAAEAEDKGKE